MAKNKYQFKFEGARKISCVTKAWKKLKQDCLKMAIVKI